jgi:hypothetical protein
MNGAKIFLSVSAAVWLPYGLYCFVAPDALAANAGVAATTTTGAVELKAMYGGLQAAFGLLALAGTLRADWRRHALVALLFVCAGLGSSRLLAALGAGELSLYTALALVFEWGSTIVCARLLARQ